MDFVHFDTNTYTAFKLGVPDAKSIVSHAEQIVMSVIVLGELRGGFAAGARTAQNNRELQEFLGGPRVSVAHITPEVADRYAAIYAQLRHDGRPIPTNDMWIAAAASMQAHTVLYSLDPHFRYVKGLRLVTNEADFLELDF